jgi:alkanesulfonate monooxygenase SsuD/methylene tetrahydromethanopterin reductase-like flavin-dependent oxidoreductase (luciferase family)
LPIDPLPADFPIITGSVQEIADSLEAFTEAGASEVQLIVDPLTPAAIETVGRVAETFVDR